MSDITFLFFDSCPHWREANTNLALALAEVERSVSIEYRTVDTFEDAEALGFRGSPSILVNEIDPFAHPDDPIGLSCRVYRTPEGPAGTPTVPQLVGVLESLS